MAEVNWLVLSNREVREVWEESFVAHLSRGCTASDAPRSLLSSGFGVSGLASSEARCSAVVWHE